MQQSTRITFRDIPHSDAVEAAIREKAEKLHQYFDRIIACDVVVEAPHTHHNKGVLYHVRIDLTVPDEELVVSRSHDDKHAHEDVYVAIRDAFDAMRRQLKVYARKHHDHHGRDRRAEAEEFIISA